jgi:hypothetical protein
MVKADNLQGEVVGSTPLPQQTHYRGFVCIGKEI